MPPEPDVPWVALCGNLGGIRYWYLHDEGSWWTRPNLLTDTRCDWPHIVRVARYEGLSITLPGETVL